MTYKKIISVFSAFLFIMLSMATNVFAAKEDMFVSAETAEEMRADMAGADNSSFGFVFGAYDVLFDYSHAFPLYALDNANPESAEKPSDMMREVGIYYAPQYNRDGKFNLFAAFIKKDGKWELCGSAGDDTLYDIITFNSEFSERISSYPEIYMIDFTGMEIGGILLVSEGEETFFDLRRYRMGFSDYEEYTDELFINGDDFLDMSRKNYEKWKDLPPDSAGGGGGSDFMYDEITEDTTPDDNPTPEEDVEYVDFTSDSSEEQTIQPADETAASDSADNDTENSDEAAGSGKDVNAAENPQTGNFPFKALAASFALTALTAFAVGKARH